MKRMFLQSQSRSISGYPGAGTRSRFKQALFAFLLIMGLLTSARVDSAYAFNIDLDVQPRVTYLGGTFRCTFTVKGLNNPPTPKMPSSTWYQEPTLVNKGKSFQVNKHRQIEYSYSYTFSVVPTKTGTFDLGPIQYAAKGKAVTFPLVALEVLAPDGTEAQQGRTEINLDDYVFATLTASLEKVYNQQFFDLTLSLYARGIKLGRDISLRNMPSSGLNFQPFQELRTTQEVIDNHVYTVRRFTSKARALTARSFHIEPVIQTVLLIPQPRKSRRRFSNDPFNDAFDSLFSDRFFQREARRPYDVKVKPLEINITPLPEEGRPDNYSGAVGQFVFDVKVKPTEVALGDPITITLQITGEGNVDSISAPQIINMDGFRVYESKLLTKSFDPQKAYGQKIFEQVIIPNTPDAQSISTIAFSYFDPETETYKSSEHGPFPLVLDVSSNAKTKLVQAQNRDFWSQEIGRDLVYLKPESATWLISGKTRWFMHPLALSLQVIPVLALTALYLFVRRRDELEQDVAKARRLRAPRIARQAIQQAKAALSGRDPAPFYEAVWEALATYFGDRLNLAPGEVSRDRVTELFKSIQAPPSLIKDIEALFNRSEEQRFGSGAIKSGSLADRREREEVLNRLKHALSFSEGLKS